MTTDEQILEDVLYRLSWIDRAILDGSYYRDKPRPYSDGYRGGINDCIHIVAGYQGGLINERESESHRATKRANSKIRR